MLVLRLYSDWRPTLTDGKAPMTATYDRIGSTYATYRRPDPRISAVIEAALGDATTVLDVGAGAGSY